MIPRIGFSLEKTYDRPLSQVIPLLKEAGFSAVSPVWDPELDLGALDACVRAEGMVIQSLHAPHKNIASLWTPDSQEAAAVRNNLSKCLLDCERFQIPVLVVHCWQGHQYTFPDKSLDFSAFDDLTRKAALHGVCIAFENLEGEEYLEALLSRYTELPQVGFCWDSGHDHCYPHRTDFLKCYGDRLVMTHLNDNLGMRGKQPSKTDDLHFLPGDGNVDWDRAIWELALLPEQEILNFELKKTSKSSVTEDLLYQNMPLEEFFAKAGKQGWKIAQKYATIRENKC